MTAVYDAAVFVAAERNDRSTWADHKVRLQLGLVPMTTACVVAQVSRSPRQAQLRRFLRGCRVAPFRSDEAHGVGRLLTRAGTSDVVDAHVAFVAGAIASSVILTSDVDDLEKLSSELPHPVPVRRA